MPQQSFCRVGVFYDGSYFACAQQYYWYERRKGWLDLRRFQALLQEYVHGIEQDYTYCRIVYAAWFQGMFPQDPAYQGQTQLDRSIYQNLMLAGIEPRFLLASSTADQQKCAFVAMAVDAMRIGLEGKIDVAALVTCQGDFVPLSQALMTQGIRVMAAHFEYDGGTISSRIDPQLLTACNYGVDVCSLEGDAEGGLAFSSLFWQPAAQPPSAAVLERYMTV